MDHADADPRLADVDVAHLLVDQLLGDGFLGIALKLAGRNIGPRTHDAGRLRVGRIDANRLLGDNSRADRKAQSGHKAQSHSLHYGLPPLPFLARHARTFVLIATALAGSKASKRRFFSCSPA